jgi:hypothetical protein
LKGCGRLKKKIGWLIVMSKTIGLAPLRDFSKYLLYSGFVKNAPRPVSGLIVAPPERGKSTEAQRWEGLGVLTIQDVTSYGIDRYLLSLSDKDREIFHHVVIPDLEKIGSRNRSVKEELLSKMRILMDEGLERVCTGRDFLNLKEPLKILAIGGVFFARFLGNQGAYPSLTNSAIQ